MEATAGIEPACTDLQSAWNHFPIPLILTRKLQ